VRTPSFNRNPERSPGAEAPLLHRISYASGEDPASRGPAGVVTTTTGLSSGPISARKALFATIASTFPTRTAETSSATIPTTTIPPALEFVILIVPYSRNTERLLRHPPPPPLVSTASANTSSASLPIKTLRSSTLKATNTIRDQQVRASVLVATCCLEHGDDARHRDSTRALRSADLSHARAQIVRSVARVRTPNGCSYALAPSRVEMSCQRADATFLSRRLVRPPSARTAFATTTRLSSFFPHEVNWGIVQRLSTKARSGAVENA